MSNGAVSLASGVGCQFTIGPGVAPQSTNYGWNLRTKKILVVEDDTLVRSVLRILLKQMGHSVLEAPDGASGLEVARAFHGKIDLVISDVATPKMNGPDMVRSLVAERPDIKVLLMSAYSPESLPRDLTEDFLPKPFVPAAIRARVGEMLVPENEQTAA